MLPALAVFQYFLVQFAPATKGSEVTEPHWTTLIHTATEPPTAEREWGSVGQQRHAHDAQAQEPVACCKLLLMLHFELMLHGVASAANQFRFHLQFYSRCEFEEDREEGGGGEVGLRFGGIFGNQSLDVIIGHINSALASQQCCIYWKLMCRPLHQADSFDSDSDCDSISVCNCVLDPIGSTEIGSLAGLAITQKRRLDRQPDGQWDGQLNCQSFCHSFNCSWQRAKWTNGQMENWQQ